MSQVAQFRWDKSTFRRFRAGRAFAGNPSRHEGQNDKVPGQAFGIRRGDDFDILVEADKLGLDAGFLFEFSQGGIGDLFAGLQMTAWQSEKPRIRWLGARCQQNAAVAEDGNAHADMRTWGVVSQLAHG